ncbi:MAG: hypothetical protein ACYC6L_04635 [Anaerolineae bacterium]
MFSKRIIIAVLCCVILVSVSVMPAVAEGPHAITGQVTFQSPPAWNIPDPQMVGNMQITAKVVGPDGAAEGWWRFQAYKESFGGWRRIDGRVLRMVWGVYNGKPAVSVLVQVTRAEGFGTAAGGAAIPDPAVGEYGWLWFCDGGPHGPESNDLWANKKYSFSPFKEYFPTLPTPFTYFDPGSFVVPVIGGNITIHGE